MRLDEEFILLSEAQKILKKKKEEELNLLDVMMLP